MTFFSSYFEKTEIYSSSLDKKIVPALDFDASTPPVRSFTQQGLVLKKVCQARIHRNA